MMASRGASKLLALEAAAIWLSTRPPSMSWAAHVMGPHDPNFATKFTLGINNQHKYKHISLRHQKHTCYVHLLALLLAWAWPAADLGQEVLHGHVDSRLGDLASRRLTPSPYNKILNVRFAKHRFLSHMRSWMLALWHLSWSG